MTLNQIKIILVNRNWVSSKEIAQRFKSDVKTVELMMQHWVLSGQVEKKITCSHCVGCMQESCEAYLWSS